jgi:hypothetical protein
MRHRRILTDDSVRPSMIAPTAVRKLGAPSDLADVLDEHQGDRLALRGKADKWPTR